MENIFYNIGNDLEDSVRNNIHKNAGKLIKQIKKHFDDNIENNSLDFIISKLFDEQYNLLKFLKQITDLAQRKEWKEILSATLDLLYSFVDNFHEKLKSYFIDIIKTCSLISLSKAQATEKVKSLEILCFIIKKDSDIPNDVVSNLYTTYFNFCNIHQSNTSAKIQKGVFMLLGAISNKYPYAVTNQNILFDAYLNQLKNQLELGKSNYDNYIVSGCFDGLSNILESFPIVDVECKNKLFNIIKKFLFFGSTSFDIRDVVIFLSRHFRIIIEEIYNESFDQWFHIIREWALSKGENKKAGCLALHTFYAELANLLKNKNDDKGKQIFKFFYEYFLKTMKNESVEINEVHLAIRGFGIFAEPCKVHMTEQSVSQMFIIIVNRIQHDYFLQENPNIDQLEYLSDYIQCFSTILFHMDEYNLSQIESLQQISVLMIRTFPKLSPLFHFSVFESLVLSMCYLQQRNLKFFKEYLHKVIYYGIIWTCSHRTIFEIESQASVNNNQKTITYKNYLPLWNYLFTFVKSSSTKFNHIPPNIKESVIQMVYDEFMKVLFLLLNKLNLNTISRDDIPIIDPENACDAEKIDDFIIFINVVDFYCDILPSTNANLFNKWMKRFTNQIIAKSYQYPFISGFYKLLRLSMQISNNINYFNEVKLQENEDRQLCYKKIMLYLEKVLSDIHEFKDDLLVACIQLLLSIPIPFVTLLLPFVSPVFNMAFTISRGYLKLAEIAVDTLSKWYQELPYEDMKPLLKCVLPNLDPFLRNKGFDGDADANLSYIPKKSKGARSKMKIFVEKENELSNLQYKILRFVGQLDLEICSYLVEANNVVERFSWNSEPYLKFSVPYNDMKPSIFLDKLIPRVLDLSLTSGDQKIRITACEFLHSIVIFMLGTNRQMSITKKDQMTKLFQKIILPLIHLGCDSNDIIRQLFNPLVFQIIHFYSSPMQLMSIETDILIDNLMDGIAYCNNVGVRDLSGKCIQEFVTWTIKQSSKEDLEKNSQHIYVIVKKICLFAVHPNSSKRFGAALAFNYLHRHLREEESLIDKYWIELLHSFLISLSLEDTKNKNFFQLNTALRNIERVLREKNQLFNQNSIYRRIPTNIEGPLLKDALFWIFKQTSSLNTIYRRKCIDLFCNLAPYVNSHYGCLKDFVVKFISNKNVFIQQYEDNLAKMVTLEYKTSGKCDILKWFQYLLCCLDGYEYLLNYNVIDNNFLLENSQIYISIKYYMEYVSSIKMEDIVKMSESFEIEEETILEWKRLIVISILNFIISMKANQYPDLCEEYFWKFLCNCVYQPNILGFYSAEISDRITIMFEKLTNVFNKICKTLPPDNLQRFSMYFVTYFKENYDQTITFNCNYVPLKQRNLLRGWLLIQNTHLINTLGNNCSEYFSNSIKLIFDDVIKNNNALIEIKLKSTIEEYANLHLKLAFMLTDYVEILCSYLLNDEEIKHTETSFVTFREKFFDYFKETIIGFLAKDNERIIQTICKYWMNFERVFPIVIIINILKYISENNQMKMEIINEQFMINLINNCLPMFNTSSELTFTNRNLQLELLTYITRVFINISQAKTCLSVLKHWFTNQLEYNPFNENQKTVLQYHSKVLSFNHFFTEGFHDQDINLQSAVDKFLNMIRESNQLESSDLLVLFKKLLDYFEVSNTKLILFLIINIFTLIEIEEDTVNIERHIKQSFKNSSKYEYDSIIFLYEHCCNKIHNDRKAYQLTKFFLKPMLCFCSYKIFEEFYIKYIPTIIGNFETILTNANSSYDIISKSINLNLIEILFSRINISNFANKSCPITKAYFINKNQLNGNELLKECIRIVKDILKLNLWFEDNSIQELYRLHQCDAFNALISIICNSRIFNEKLDVFRLCFFEKQNIWYNIIDCKKQIVLLQDFTKLPERKKVFINIRKKHQIKEDQIYQYIESQSLFNSTLSEDITKYDFSNTLVRNADFRANENEIEIQQSIESVVFESVDFNNHECMATICGLINYMIDENVSPLPSEANTTTLPSWIEDIQKILLTAERNIKIFIARLIFNTKHIFKYYAKYFFEPIIKIIVDNSVGNCLNYFVADLVEMLLSWSNNIDLSENRNEISELISYLMENACSDDQKIIKYNLEIIRTCVKVWKTVIIVPVEIIQKNLTHSNINKKLIGIHLAGILLTYNLIPWSDSNIANFMKNVVNILKTENTKKIYKPNAELIGMILNVLSKDQNNDTQFQFLMKQLDIILNPAKSDKFFHAIDQIQINYPSIINNYIKKIGMHLYSQTDSIIICICLKNILRSIDVMEFKFLTWKDLIKYLNEEDLNIRLITLQLVNKLILSFTESQQIDVINAVCEYKTDKNPNIRCAVYDILITVYNKYDENSSENKKLIKLCKPILLFALIDSNLELQEKMEKFWYERYQLLNLPNKFEKFLIDFYAPENESYYMCYVNYFLLESCKDASEYSKKLFDHPLSDCKFEDYQFMINWRFQNASLTPMFSHLYSKLENIPQLIGVRASNSLKMFSPTVSSINLSSTLSTNSSFILNIKTDEIMPLTATTYSKQNQKTNASRFLNDKIVKLNYAKTATERKIIVAQEKKDRIKRKEANIVMYRQYRMGELPDIQIPFSAIIDPLKILVKKDNILARQVYTMLFNGIINEMNASLSEQFIQNFSQGLLAILNQSYQYNPNVIGTFLDIIFENNQKNTKKIVINSDVLSIICKNSGLIPLGCLLIEEYINLVDYLPSNPKKAFGESTEDVNLWVKLADMYKELNEWDVTMGIFTRLPINFSSDIAEAISAEANNKWKKAMETYEYLLNKDTDLNRKDIYYESYFKCFSNLSDWSNMSKHVNHLSEPSFWDGSWNQEILLPWYMMTEMCSMLEENSKVTIINNLNEWMKDKEKSEYLKDKFSEELAILSLLQNDLNASKCYTKHCFAKFLEDWSQQNPLFSKLRSKKFFTFQKVIDLSNYLLNINDNATNIINNWQKNLNLTLQSVPATEIRTLYRLQFIKSLENKISSEESNITSLDLNELKLSFCLNLVSHSLRYQNYTVARKYCKISKNFISKEDNLAMFRLYYLMSKVGVLLANNLSGEHKLQKLVDSWDQLDKICKKNVNNYTNLQIDSACQIYKITQLIGIFLEKDTNVFIEQETKIKKLISSQTSLLPDLLKYGVNKLRYAIDMGENNLKYSENNRVLKSLTKCYVNLILFTQSQPDVENYYTDIVKYVLRAMKFGSKEAQQIFPYILQFPHFNQELVTVFKEESLTIPSWMFLLWIPQLIASLDSCVEAVSHIMERLATDYPQALIYAYRFSRDKLDVSKANESLKNLIYKLDNLLNMPIVDKFLTELSYICVPQLYFNYHLERIHKNCKNFTEMRNMLNTLIKDLKTKIDISKHFNSVKTNLENLEINVNATSDLEELKIEIIKVYEMNRKHMSIKTNKLKLYSIWLANFQGVDSELEVPGQYTGECKPLIKYHARILNFSEKVMVNVKSLRKPIKIIMYGNDSKEYPFLVKFGEDLRQDQRIQILYSLVNKMLHTDFNCQQRNLFIEQYQVIPLKESFGLIKIVEDTVSLMDLIRNNHVEQNIFHDIQIEYLNWIKSASNDVQNNDKQYAKAYLFYNKDETNRMFNKLVNSIPHDILRKAIWNVSVDNESFIYLRQQFITSYSVMCIVHWLLGIGDRNLGNCLISEKSGRAIGIDFGNAFGISTQNSLIPELIPFRLTPHILSIMEPLKETGFVEYTMMHVLKVLRKNKHLLLSTMDVFIKDPSVDWLEYAESVNEKGNFNYWSPKQKIDIAMQKLNGANSAAITVQELSTGRITEITTPVILQACINVAKGDEFNIRNKLPLTGLNEEDQVKCLIDQATDYNVLGRGYHGLELWI